MAKAPAFQFYANDFMDATRFWSTNAVGLFIRCLCIQWTHGGLPSDVRTLASGVGMSFEEFEASWKTVSGKFEMCEDGSLRNSRLEAVRSRQDEVSSKRSNAGRASAIARANASTNVGTSVSTKNKQRKVKEKEKVEEEGVKENRDPESAQPIEIFPADFPPSMRTPSALAAWTDWERSRREKGKPITATARKLQLADCEAWGTERAIAAMQNSTKGNYQGLFEPSKPSIGDHSSTLKTADPTRKLTTL